MSNSIDVPIGKYMKDVTVTINLTGAQSLLTGGSGLVLNNNTRLRLGSCRRS